MPVFQTALTLNPPGAGLHEITAEVADAVRRSGCRQGLAAIFCRHTSCSLVLMENADPTARADLEGWLDRLVPGDDPRFTHTLEGADDMPSHIKMALTRSSETVPLADGRLQLGTWQGIFLWEHRRHPPRRTVLVTVMGE